MMMMVSGGGKLFGNFQITRRVWKGGTGGRKRFLISFVRPHALIPSDGPRESWDRPDQGHLVLLSAPCPNGEVDSKVIKIGFHFIGIQMWNLIIACYSSTDYG
jgi:hypothetical protein